MTEPSGPSHIIPFWPVWTRTLDAMIRGLASVRSRCRHCGSLLRLNLGTLRARLGGFASLIDRTGPCPVVGCTGTVYYLGAPATGAAYHVLIGDLALFHGVAVPVALARHGDDRTRILPCPGRGRAIAGCALRQGELP